MVTAKWSTNPGARFLYAGNFVTATSTILRRDGVSADQDRQPRLAGIPRAYAREQPVRRGEHPFYEPGSSAVGLLWRRESRNACTSRVAWTLAA
jgi:hypothetical protein